MQHEPTDEWAGQDRENLNQDVNLRAGTREIANWVKKNPSRQLLNAARVQYSRTSIGNPCKLQFKKPGESRKRLKRPSLPMNNVHIANALSTITRWEAGHLRVLAHQQYRHLANQPSQPVTLVLFGVLSEFIFGGTPQKDIDTLATRRNSSLTPSRYHRMKNGSSLWNVIHTMDPHKVARRYYRRVVRETLIVTALAVMSEVTSQSNGGGLELEAVALRVVDMMEEAEIHDRPTTRTDKYISAIFAPNYKIVGLIDSSTYPYGTFNTHWPHLLQSLKMWVFPAKLAVLMVHTYVSKKNGSKRQPSRPFMD
ncbi:hypothetical protein FB451DRAFT_1185527 [Mycena latifolia]|nr:hypothetical protein FB451DRAFT_1185527 [Mycena latifolia]